MTGWLVFTGVIVLIVLLLRYWRKRELEAFLETDMSALDEFREQEAGARQAVRTVASNVVDIPPRDTPSGDTESPSVYELREAIFDDVHRSCLKALDKVIEKHHRLFVHVPLQDLVRSDQKEYQDRLQAHTLSFLLCDRDSLGIICGIQLKGAGASEVERHAFVEEVFRQVDKPLITLPMLTTFSTLELKELLADVLTGSPPCPKCGKEMVLRKAVKGKNAGKNFWVCRAFPECKGLTRIGRF